MKVNVLCAVIFFDDKVLVTQRSTQMTHPLKWEFPGGKLEVNESEVDCIIREIKEEINIEIKIGKRLSEVTYCYPTITITLIPYLAQYLGGQIKLSEHSNYKLLGIAELMELEWAEADVPIVKQLQLLFIK